MKKKKNKKKGRKKVYVTIGKSTKGTIYVHCPDNSCNEFSTPHVITLKALGKRVCVCGKNLIPYDYEGGRPVMPKGHSSTPNPSYVPKEEKTDTKKDGDTASVVFGLIAIVFWGAVIVKCTTGSNPIDKATGFFEKRSDAKEYCAEKAEDATSNYAAKKIYKACMSNY